MRFMVLQTLCAMFSGAAIGLAILRWDSMGIQMVVLAGFALGLSAYWQARLIGWEP